MSYAGYIHFAYAFENYGKVIVTSGSDTKTVRKFLKINSTGL